jgi:hypothetical protein
VARNECISASPSLGYACVGNALPGDFVSVVYDNDWEAVFCPNARRGQRTKNAVHAGNVV